MAGQLNELWTPNEWNEEENRKKHEADQYYEMEEDFVVENNIPMNDICSTTSKIWSINIHSKSQRD